MKTTIKSFKSGLHLIAFAMVVTSVCLTACSSSSNNSMPTPNKVTYTGTFTKDSVIIVSSATGTVSSTFDPSTMVLSFTMSWNNLSTLPIEMHFHDKGVIIIPITGFTSALSGTYTGTATFTAAQANDLAAGKVYINIHTQNYPAGEIFATLTTSGTPNPPSPGY